MIESTELLKKLQVKSGARLWLINVPSPLAEALTAGAEVEPVHPGEAYDGALVFCDTPSEVEALADRVVAGLPQDGLLWFAYRKGAAARKSGLNRDVGWAPLERAGYRPVRSISLDATWTGLRFREAAKVKAKR